MPSSKIQHRQREKNPLHPPPYPEPPHCYQISMSPTKTSSRRSPRDKAAEHTTNYDENFQDHLISHGVYPPFSRYPDSTGLSKPGNFADIQRRLLIRRPSLMLPPDSLEKEYSEFATINAEAGEKQLVMKEILPILEGKKPPFTRTGGGYPFKNLAPLTDGTLPSAIPDFYHGAAPNQLNPVIRKQLSDQIIPSKQSNRPMAPNFFIEVKGHAGSMLAARGKACYDGALGARAMHSLQQFGNESSTNMPANYDGNAYTMISVYQSGFLSIYATHPTSSRSNSPDNHPDYVMTQLGQWALSGDPETFQQGITAYRNARDLAQEQRNEFIKQANERYASAAGGFDEEYSVGSECTEYGKPIPPISLP
ncbi:hypothetical protein AOCH_004572, partial [Aspergillus ochraceoroseus]